MSHRSSALRKPPVPTYEWQAPLLAVSCGRTERVEERLRPSGHRFGFVILMGIAAWVPLAGGIAIIARFG